MTKNKTNSKNSHIVDHDFEMLLENEKSLNKSMNNFPFEDENNG